MAIHDKRPNALSPAFKWTCWKTIKNSKQKEKHKLFKDIKSKKLKQQYRIFKICKWKASKTYHFNLNYLLCSNQFSAVPLLQEIHLYFMEKKNFDVFGEFIGYFKSFFTESKTRTDSFLVYTWGKRRFRALWCPPWFADDTSIHLIGWERVCWELIGRCRWSGGVMWRAGMCIMYRRRVRRARVRQRSW